MAELPLHEYIARIEDWIGAGQTDEAIQHCHHILAQVPGYFRAQRLLGIAYQKQGQTAEAIDSLQPPLVVDPEHSGARASLGHAYEAQGRLQGAIWQLERAFDLAPGAIEVRQDLLRLYALRDGAETVALKLESSALGRIYAYNGQLDQAIAEYQSALEKDPHLPDVQVGLAEAFWREGRRLEAVETCLDLLRVMPSCLKANLILGQVLFSSGQESAARERLSLAQATDPENRIAHELMGDESPLPLLDATLPEMEPEPAAAGEPSIDTTEPDPGRAEAGAEGSEAAGEPRSSQPEPQAEDLPGANQLPDERSDQAPVEEPVQVEEPLETAAAPALAEEDLKAAAVAILEEKVLEAAAAPAASEEEIEAAPVAILEEEEVETAAAPPLAEEVIESAPMTILEEKGLEAAPAPAASEEEIEAAPVAILKEEEPQAGSAAPLEATSAAKQALPKWLQQIKALPSEARAEDHSPAEATESPTAEGETMPEDEAGMDDEDVPAPAREAAKGATGVEQVPRWVHRLEETVSQEGLPAGAAILAPSAGEPAAPTVEQEPLPTAEQEADQARRAELRALVDLQPGNYRARIELARRCRQERDWNGALIHYEELIAGHRLIRAAILDLQSLLDEDTDKVQVYRLLGDAYMEVDQVDQALEMYRLARQILRKR